MSMQEKHQKTPPSERFDPPSDRLRVGEVADELIAQAQASEHGRAQRTLYRHRGVTIAMFAFSDGGSLPSHAAAAVVSVHLVHGRVSMRAGEQAFELSEGDLVRMEPRVVHEVRAMAPSAILVHIAGVTD